jgi:pimeloyl-ACP methyl ester carboxylesterase
VVGLISMAGGRGGRAFGTAASYCQPDSLVAAAGVFGARAEKPMLWISAANDTYFDPDLERRMARAFGAATLVVTPPLGAEGHFLFYDAGGPEIWGPIVTRYLDQRRQAAAPKS